MRKFWTRSLGILCLVGLIAAPARAEVQQDGGMGGGMGGHTFTLHPRTDSAPSISFCSASCASV